MIVIQRSAAGIVLRLEYALGKDDNHRLYLTLGTLY